MIEHRGRRHLEVAPEQLEERLGGQAIGERRRLAQIAVPQRRRDLLAVAAPDQAIEHRLARALAEIGVGNILRDAALELGFERNGELAGDALELGDLAVGEAGGPVAEPGTEDAVLRHAVEAHHEHDIVGAARHPHFLEGFEIEERRLAG